MDWRAIQRQLASRGFDPGPIDGVRGRLTNAAIVAFKKSAGLKATPYYGPITEAALFGKAKRPPFAAAPPVDLPWMDEARSLEGTREKPGKASNPKIIGWAKGLRLWYPGDDVPWCGLFVAHCIGSTMPREPLPGNPLGARNWRNFGVATHPRLGAVMVFWRGSRNGIYGHVGFYVGEDRTHYHILGGNQSDAVNVRRVPKDRFLAARWPSSFNAATGEVAADASEAEATDGNEA